VLQLSLAMKWFAYVSACAPVVIGWPAYCVIAAASAGGGALIAALLAGGKTICCAVRSGAV
jgi:hypothetical protein